MEKVQSDLSAIRHKLVVMKLELEAAIQKLDEMQDQRFEVLNCISSAEFGKQRFFKEKNGTIYDRLKQYAYIMGGGAYDLEDGFWKPTKEGLGFAHVFDEINRLIPTKTGRPYIRYLLEGGEMERARKLAEEKEKQ